VTGRVRLRDLTVADVDLLDAWNREDPSEFNDFSEEPMPLPREAIEAGPLRNDRNGMLIVERTDDGTVVGTIGWHRVNYGPNPQSDAWNIGIELRPEHRGNGFGSEAQRLLADFLFDTYDLNRVEAQTDVDNAPEQRALEKAGYVREGIARGSQFRAGAYHDLVTFSRLRTDPE
jgi:RimJ/RimL family protein N-acetyltransferase